MSISVCAASYNALTGAKGVNRKHFIRAELVQWNFAPGGTVDQCTGEALTNETSVSPYLFSSMKASCLLEGHESEHWGFHLTLLGMRCHCYCCCSYALPCKGLACRQTLSNLPPSS